MSESTLAQVASVPTKYRNDYTPPTHFIETVALDFHLSEVHTRVSSRMKFRTNPANRLPGNDLVLHGENLKLVRVMLDNVELDKNDYVVAHDSLTIRDTPPEFILDIEVVIEPQENTCFEGLYRSGPMFLTQCEAEGFRRITYFLDRPDVMARFTTTLSAEKASCPVLLSNGNLVESGEHEDGRHWARWEDPFRKPSYLFALVAGEFHCEKSSFATMSGRDVELRVYVENHHADKCTHAIESLKHSMKWDEETYGREYDLDLYMIVATDDFNMGAMENKGLNIFNSKFVLARSDIATDADYERIEGVIGHEYFHNWTGNRVTCRDWFQLTLKEGLTVFRDQEFTAARTSASVKRIDDVTALRGRQFPEDAGPLAHPIRPESYQEMNNFYTATVYEKGAEVIRMYQTLLGVEGFRKGLDLYFERHDGQAVTCDDFRAAMADSNRCDLSQFESWYIQAGTPVVTVSDEYQPAERRRKFTFTQSVRQITGQDAPSPLPIPIAFGLIGPDGSDVALKLKGEELPGSTTRILELTEFSQVFSFDDVPDGCVPSYLRGFSAPVELKVDRSHSDYAFAMANDSDPFNRWEAGQQFSADLIVKMTHLVADGREPVLDKRFVEAWGKVLEDDSLDRSLVSLTLTIPAESYLSERFKVLDPASVHATRKSVIRQLAKAHKDLLRSVYLAHRTKDSYSLDRTEISRRRLSNTCLRYLSALGDVDICVEQFGRSDNMTDTVAALGCLCDHDGRDRQLALEAFYERWKHEPLAIDKWFGLQASSDLSDSVERVVALTKHSDFTLRNPNRVRALLGVFGVLNPVHFHRRDGAGYQLLGRYVCEMDTLNPQVAARLIDPMLKWKNLEPVRQELLRSLLEEIISTNAKLSPDLHEKISKALAAG